MLTPEQERRKRAYRGADCASVRVDGIHQFYACQTHVFIVMADIAQGDETMWIDLWSVPTWLIGRNQEIRCVYHDR